MIRWWTKWLLFNCWWRLSGWWICSAIEFWQWISCCWHGQHNLIIQYHEGKCFFLLFVKECLRKEVRMYDLRSKQSLWKKKWDDKKNKQSVFERRAKINYERSRLWRWIFFFYSLSTHSRSQLPYICSTRKSAFSPLFNQSKILLKKRVIPVHMKSLCKERKILFFLLENILFFSHSGLMHISLCFFT